MEISGSLKGHNNSVNCVRFGENHTLASGSDDSSCRIWDARTSKTVQCMTGMFEDEPVVAVEFCTRPFMFYASAGSSIYTFDLRNEVEALQVDESTYNSDEINHIARHPRKNSPFLATCDDSGQISIVDVEQSRLYKTLYGGHTNICSMAKFRPKAAWEIVSGGLDSKILFWDFSRGSIKASINIEPLAESTESQGGNQIFNPPLVHSIEFHPSGRQIVAGLGDSSIALIDYNEKKIKQRLVWHRAAVCAVHFSSSDRFISIGNDNQIAMWDYLTLNDNPAREVSACGDLVKASVMHKNRCNWIDSSTDTIYVADVSQNIILYSMY